MLEIISRDLHMYRSSNTGELHYTGINVISEIIGLDTLVLRGNTCSESNEDRSSSTHCMYH